MSTSAKKLGAVAVVAGALELLTYLAGKLFLGSYEPKSESAKRLSAVLTAVPGWPLVGLGLPLLGALLIVVGFAILRRTDWARQAALGWSIGALLFLAAMVTFNVVMVWPRIDADREIEIQRGATENALRGYESMKGAPFRNALLRAPFAILLLVRRRQLAAPPG